MILVTGSQGLIGTALCDHLRRTSRPRRHYDLKLGQDILDMEKLRRSMDGCSVVVHLAAISRIVPAERDQVTAYRTNVVGTENVARAALEAGAFMIHASSREVYGTTSEPTTESDALSPESFYGVTKAYAEGYIRTLRSKRGLMPPYVTLPHVILRLSNVYGGVNDHPDRVVPAFMRSALNGETMTVNGNGAFDFVHVDDVVRAIMLAIMAGPDSRMTCNVVTGVSTRLMVLAHMCGEAARRDARIMPEHERSLGAKGFRGCPALAESELGWRAQIDLWEGLARYARLVGPVSCK